MPTDRVFSLMWWDGHVGIQNNSKNIEQVLHNNSKIPYCSLYQHGRRYVMWTHSIASSGAVSGRLGKIQVFFTMNRNCELPITSSYWPFARWRRFTTKTRMLLVNKNAFWQRNLVLVCSKITPSCKFRDQCLSLQKFGFIKRVDKCWITTVKDLESWRFEQ